MLTDLRLAWLGCLTTDSDWLFDFLRQSKDEVRQIEQKIDSYHRRAERRLRSQK